MSGQGNTKNRRRALTATLVATALLVACGGDGGDEKKETDQAAAETPTETEAPATDESWVAQAKDGVSEVEVYAAPDDDEPIHRLPNPKPVGVDGLGPLVFLVDGTDVDGEWLPVHLPVPPTGSKGFIRADDVDVASHDYRIIVELSNHTLTVTKGGEPVIETEAGLGRAGRETPEGLYFITELLESPNPDGAYGPYAYGISGFPDDPEIRAEFGSDATLGIHGTNEPDKIGTAVSSGCIRVHNDVITEMAQMLPLGVPVEVVA